MQICEKITERERMDDNAFEQLTLKTIDIQNSIASKEFRNIQISFITRTQYVANERKQVQNTL